MEGDSSQGGGGLEDAPFKPYNGFNFWDSLNNATIKNVGDAKGVIETSK